MPTLDWIGKQAVVNHHREVPTRLLHCNGELSFGDPDAGNLLVEGDNLEALKALLPYYAGKVKCIFIDPPYNTGNEGWIYDDNVNSPEIRSWLGKVVGGEAEDLSRHDKWMCMMYPRLRVLREFLAEDASIWVTIDDNEGHSLKLIMDEIFGRRSFVATIVWENRYSRSNDASVSMSHNFVLVYARDVNIWKRTRNRLTRTGEQSAQYTNPDHDPNGPWRAIPWDAPNVRANLSYPIMTPKGRVRLPPPGRCWSRTEDQWLDLVNKGRAYFGKSEDGAPAFKQYLSEAGNIVPNTWWAHEEAGHTDEAKKEILALFGTDDAFATPKPERLLKRILEIATNPGDLVLDSFAGSGTTGAVASKMDRHWIMVEMGQHCRTLVAPRLQKIIGGSDPGGITQVVGWKGGGGLRYCQLGKPLFDEYGAVTEGVTFSDLAAFVYFSDTGSPIPRRAEHSSLLIGTFQERAIYLLFAAASAGVPDPRSGNTLTIDVLKSLPKPSPDFSGPRIVYGEGCTVPAERLAAEGVVFKQVPYQLVGA